MLQLDLNDAAEARAMRLGEIYERNRAAMRLKALRADLRRVEAAVRRVEAGEYGYCARCGEAIGLHRLEADPSAALCQACEAEVGPGGGSLR